MTRIGRCAPLSGHYRGRAIMMMTLVGAFTMCASAIHAGPKPGSAAAPGVRIRRLQPGDAAVFAIWQPDRSGHIHKVIDYYRFLRQTARSPGGVTCLIYQSTRMQVHSIVGAVYIGPDNSQHYCGFGRPGHIDWVVVPRTGSLSFPGVLRVGATWTSSRRTSQGTRFSGKHTVVKSTVVKVPAGVFKTFLVRGVGEESRGRAARPTLSLHWFSPELGMTVRSEETLGGLRLTETLLSYQLAGGRHRP